MDACRCRQCRRAERELWGTDLDPRPPQKKKPRRGPQPGYKTRKPRQKTYRYLYAIEGRGAVKVGVTNNPDERIRTHKYQGMTDVLWVYDFGDKDAEVVGTYWRSLPSVGATYLIPDGHTEAVAREDVGDYLERVEAMCRKMQATPLTRYGHLESTQAT